MPNQNHLQNETNILDPDDGISWLCTACKLPIFATPFSGGGGGAAPLLHDHCANLPAVLLDCEFHPKQPMFLRDNNDDETCSECSQKCGSKLYYCRDSGCGLVLDVACALPVRILHRSHRHRLIAVRGGAGNTCGICGAVHKTAEAEVEGRSYFCSACGFWIHPQCATSANVIKHEKHAHPLVLYYDVGAAFGAQHSTPMDADNFISQILEHSAAPPPLEKNDGCVSCAICGNGVGTRVGIYACIKCRDAVFHISCATSDRRIFKPVLSRDAHFPSLVRLPMLDEHLSIVGFVREATSGGDDDKKDLSEYAHTVSEDYLRPFTLHHEDINSVEGGGSVCDVCLKIINKPHFYRSSFNHNVLLHDYCYRLPRFLSSNSVHTSGHHFALVISNEPDDLGMFMDGSTCRHCGCSCIRAFYMCWRCRPQINYVLDVSCALMPNVITHEAHSTAHFLRLSESSSRRSQDNLDCACCLRPLGMLAYECRTCQEFALHTWCAMLPKTVSHKFDTHPLRLTTTECLVDICEICERGIEEKVWRYSCERCDQSFHVDCIPCLDMHYKIKSLVSEGVRLPNVPKRLIRGLTLQGHGHGEEYCRDVADEYDDILSSD